MNHEGGVLDHEGGEVDHKGGEVDSMKDFHLLYTFKGSAFKKMEHNEDYLFFAICLEDAGKLLYKYDASDGTDYRLYIYK